MPLWTPANAVVTPALWIDFSDSTKLFNATSGGSLPGYGSGIARVEDKSGNARHFTQATAGSQPIRTQAVKNNLDMAFFDGTDDRVAGNAAALTTFKAASYVSCFAVCIPICTTPASIQTLLAGSVNALGNGRFALDIHDGGGTGAIVNRRRVGGRRLDADSFTNITPFDRVHGDTELLEGIANYAGGQWDLRIFGASVGTSAMLSSGTSENLDSQGFNIGANGGGAAFSTSYIGEIIILRANPNTGERQAYEGYLANKWGIAGGLPLTHPYRDLAPGASPAYASPSMHALLNG